MEGAMVQVLRDSWLAVVSGNRHMACIQMLSVERFEDDLKRDFEGERIKTLYNIIPVCTCSRQ